jgi:hypothetical protein
MAFSLYYLLLLSSSRLASKLFSFPSLAPPNNGLLSGASKIGTGTSASSIGLRKSYHFDLPLFDACLVAGVGFSTVVESGVLELMDEKEGVRLMFGEEVVGGVGGHF